ncbi:glycosyltransferase [bacterium]|nr:glycosyltransferase [bacterium]
MPTPPPPAPARVWFYLDRLEVGGAERIVLNLLTGLTTSAWAPTLVLNQAKGALLADVPPSVPICDLKVESFVGAILTLARKIRRERPALILSQRGYLNVIVVLARLLSGRKPRLVLTEHSLLVQSQQNDRAPKRPIDRVLQGMMPALYQVADALVGVSKGVAAELEQILGLPAGKVRVLYNPIVPAGVEALSQEPLTLPWRADGTPLIVAAGRLSPEKGFDMLLQAFVRVLERRPARLAIVGSGPEQPRLIALAAELGIAQHVHFPGFQGNIYPWLRNSDLFVLSSVVESFPTVLIEAMAVGTPVVSFDCPRGPREIITPGQDGQLVPPEDPTALAEGILQVLGDPELASRLVAGGHRRAANFTFPRTVAAYERLFASLLHRPA